MQAKAWCQELMTNIDVLILQISLSWLNMIRADACFQSLVSNDTATTSLTQATFINPGSSCKLPWTYTLLRVGSVLWVHLGQSLWINITNNHTWLLLPILTLTLKARDNLDPDLNGKRQTWCTPSAHHSLAMRHCFLGNRWLHTCQASIPGCTNHPCNWGSRCDHSLGSLASLSPAMQAWASM